jgi:hypothetical protein
MYCGDYSACDSGYYLIFNDIVFSARFVQPAHRDDFVLNDCKIVPKKCLLCC